MGLERYAPRFVRRRLARRRHRAVVTRVLSTMAGAADQVRGMPPGDREANAARAREYMRLVNEGMR